MITSRISQFTDILQQDLYFACDCLAEEIAVESELAEKILSSLCTIAKNSPFPSQRINAIRYLGLLAQTKQYASLALKELVALVIKDDLLNIDTRIHGTRTLYQSSPKNSEEQRQAIRILLDLSRHPALSIEQQLQVAMFFYEYR